MAMAMCATPSTTPSSLVSANEAKSITSVVGVFDFAALILDSDLRYTNNRLQVHGTVVITKVVTGAEVQYYATLNYCSVLRWKFSCEAGKDPETGMEEWIFYNFQLLESDFPGKDQTEFRTEVEIACIDPSRYLEPDSGAPNFPVLRCVIRYDVHPRITARLKKAECYAKWRRDVNTVAKFEGAERKELMELVRRCNFPFGEMPGGLEEENDSEPEIFQMEL
ncbi:uncharacterized protein L3040_006361 [Drepanopeziza brunnea f. sp. 'multigermtubi']|uniref:Uncharacterized protein n=1 Tax=Marssonina brunnea f. sp. multigermtubi (strain MB_m1) TaxID=1072389 RepID=K1X6B3_MARBU|nr:uncharacterized protein MBM_01319 [Drepanopeziza brunnea f. sp. 'multigermtubi' MB_m1]EKD20637.1 hypothetical protein MBM_01319 [Drepanopeziza brunnea f. sp. 'multigermtubi' MB_m1]KAJ5038681.1 hypothetical protein L3040_006361 [Drepanopeziza brunnea f. sp. 'multigermtubi']